jgi:hypothetical protein
MNIILRNNLSTYFHYVDDVLIIYDNFITYVDSVLYDFN